MPKSRTKGIGFEREIADELAAIGQVRGLESGGDHLVVGSDGHALHVECKRFERVRIPEWLRQQERDCPPGARRALIFRQSRRPAYVVEPLAQFIDRERRLAKLEGAK